MMEPAAPLADKRLVVTGARGFVGSTLLEALSHQDCDIVAVDRRADSEWSPSGKTARIDYQARDLRQAEAWDVIDETADFVIHLASVETHQKSFSAADEIAVNETSVLNLAKRIAGLARKPKSSSPVRPCVRCAGGCKRR